MAYLRICCDLDDTICFPDHTQLDSVKKYMLANPNASLINWLRYQKQQGSYIIIHTARRMLTHNGDIDAILEDVGNLTREWLEQHNVPYDELIFGKPYADIYIDDKAAKPTQL